MIKQVFTTIAPLIITDYLTPTLREKGFEVVNLNTSDMPAIKRAFDSARNPFVVITSAVSWHQDTNFGSKVIELAKQNNPDSGRSSIVYDWKYQIDRARINPNDSLSLILAASQFDESGKLWRPTDENKHEFEVIAQHLEASLSLTPKC